MMQDALMHKRICPICEAGCGLIVETKGPDVIAIEANPSDVFSNGHICAKGISLKQLHADPDRLRKPMVRKNGTLIETSWREAFATINQKLNQIKETYGANAVATYIGNPTAHNIGLATGLGVFASTLGSVNVYSAGSVDQIPKQLASEFMFGNAMALPVPDIERCDYLLMLGANPIVSNGSLWMVPNVRGKLADLKNRGGKLITVDPRLSETARVADEHYFIRPGTDAFLLMAIINGLGKKGRVIPSHYLLENWPLLQEKMSTISLGQVTNRTGVTLEQIDAIVNGLDTAEAPVVYGRVGTTLQRHGTLTSFLVEVINLLLGALDAEGGAMFPEQPFEGTGSPGPIPLYNRYQSRVSGFPEALGQMPVAVMAEEIETPGDGQIRALVCFAGNPIVSNPDSDRLKRAFETLDFMVCVDIYHNETTEHADVILPGTSPFEDSHYDSFLGSMGYKNVARYSPPVFATDNKSEWDLALTLAYIIAHQATPSDTQLREFEDNIVAATVAQYVDDQQSPLYQRDIQELVAMIGPETGVERLLDLGIRAGRWGDHFENNHFKDTDGLTLQRLIDNPDGIDLGALRANRMSEMIGRPNGKMDLAPSIILQDIDRILQAPESSEFQLIGRRSTRTNNSWLHNLPMLAKGKNLCVLELHPDDAATFNLASDELVDLSSGLATLTVIAEVTDKISKGVVSLPHGFSEHKNLLQSTAASGANYNRLAASSIIDVPSGTSALNGIPVTLSKH